MEIKNTFVGGKMSKDLDERLVPNGDYLHAENIRIISGDGSNSGLIRHALGNTALTSYSYGAGAKCVGSTVDNFSKMIYFLVRTTGQDCYIMEYDIENDTIDSVLADTRAPGSNVLNFPTDNDNIDIKVLNDSDNNKKFLFITDSLNEPRYFSVEYAKSLAINTVTEDDISLIKAPPLSAPGTILSSNPSSGTNIEERFLTFAYRYRYADGEYSTLSPFSPFAFNADDFIYDYDSSMNRGMTNIYNSITLRLNVGSERVTEIEVFYKESGNPNVYIYDRISKEERGWTTGIQDILYYNRKGQGVLANAQVNRLFDNVPIKAFCQEIIGNRVVFGNYSEGYDLTFNGDPINIDHVLDLTATAGTEGDAYRTVKSIRGYELAIVYLDGKGRMTTPLTSPLNSKFVLNSDGNKEVQLIARISHRAPDFATHFRFFLKQSKNSYHTIASDTYFEDIDTSTHVYLKINEVDLNKFSVGDTLYYKGEINALKGKQVLAKVLEVEQQEADFLGSGTQPEGLYLKVDIGDSRAALATVVIFETIPEDINDGIFYELPDTYIISNNYHTSTASSDTSQSGVAIGEFYLNFFNAFGWSNGFESNRILDDFNTKEMILDTRPSSPIDNYRQITRVGSLTWSGVYENTTGFNALNEFNLSTVNYKDLDIDYGSIQTLLSKDTDLYVFQEDKTHRVLYQKDVLYDADGTGSIRQSNKVLGQEIAMAGEYGISNNPESLSYYGNNIYHLDKKRGALMRLGADGYTEISSAGMYDYFRERLKNETNNYFHPASYNPFDDLYMINMGSLVDFGTLSYSERSKGFPSFYKFVPEDMVYLNNRMYSFKNAQLYVHDDINQTPNTFYGLTGSSEVSLSINHGPSDIKVFNYISLEGSEPWDILMKTYETHELKYAESEINLEDFVKKEGKWYSYIRRDSLSEDREGRNYYGIGNVTISGTTLNITGGEVTTMVSVGDIIYNTSNQIVGQVLSVGNGSITLNNVLNLSSGNFIIGKKDNRIEGPRMRGYTSRLDMSVLPTSELELFCVNVDVSKSFR